MKVALYVNKSIEENAAQYFESAKKSRKKIKGVEKTVDLYKQKQEEKSQEEIEVVSSIKKLSQKKLWFEKFKWFVTSEGFLAIGGRDATTNEIIIKKHTVPGDIVFHTDMAGSPFVVIKQDKSDVEKLLGSLDDTLDHMTEKSIREAAAFTLVHSKAWKLGLGGASVFWVTPEQVSKEANSGEFMAKGSFMIRGKTNYVTDYTLDFSVGLLGEHVVGAPKASLEKFGQVVADVIQGNEKASAVGKVIRSRLRNECEVDTDMDSIIRVLPAGGCQVKKAHRNKVSGANRK